MKETIVELLSEALRPVRGLSALVLGGSRARGLASPSSDYDLGLYYEENVPLHIDDLRAAITPLVDDPNKTKVGEWGWKGEGGAEGGEGGEGRGGGGGEEGEGGGEGGGGGGTDVLCRYGRPRKRLWARA